MTSINEDVPASGEPGCKTDQSKDDPGCSNEAVSVEELEEKEVIEKTSEEVRDEYFVDEEELKDKEVTYSDEDRLRLKVEAETHKNEGNLKFKQSEFKESIVCYTEGLRTCPLSYQKERAILYANRGAARVKLGFEVAAIDDCSKAIELDSKYVRALLRRAQLYEKTDKLDEAFGDFKKVLELDPANRDAVMACTRLPPLIEERNEKMKEEMIGKLKDLGNIFLKPFGLSTENFKMVQDPNTGGYNINFQQNS